METMIIGGLEMEEMVSVGEVLSKILKVGGELKPMSAEELEEFEKEKVMVYNSRPGKLKYYDCPKCLNRGEYEVRENGRTVVRECSCMDKRRAMRRMMESGLEDVITRYTYQTFETPELWQKTALEKCKEYSDNPVGWLIMTGSPGTGKTHLCTAVCGDLIKKGYDVRYFQWRTEAPGLKAYAGTFEYEDKVRPYKVAKVLYIDDFFKSKTVTEGDINLAFDIINARYNNTKLLTIISSEKTLEDMLDIDQARGSRIYERRQTYIRTSGKPNWRLRDMEGAD